MMRHSERGSGMAVVIAWLAGIVAYGALAVVRLPARPLLLDGDDAMRLTEVHDLLHGQGWFDYVQHRLNTPWGASMHWSRLVDVPEAALLVLLRPFFGAAADTALAVAWPLLLLLPLLWLTSRLALRLGGPAARWPALGLALLSVITLGEFAPGRLDHHSVQLLLTLGAALAAIEALARPRCAPLAGLAAAAALAIGVEGLPMVAATVLVFAFSWVGNGRAGALRDFGLAFALATTLALAQGVAPAEWLVRRLDAISIDYVVAAALVGLSFLGLSLLPVRFVAARLGAAVLAEALCGGLLLAFDPALLGGPYAALDPWLVEHWLAHVSESATWLQSFVDDPVYPLAVTVPVLAALGLALARMVRPGGERGAWLVYGAYLAVGLLVMLVQIRAARLVTPLAVPGGAALLVAAWRLSLRRRGFAPALGVVGSAIAGTGLAVATLAALWPLAAGSDDASPGGREACLQPAAFADLAGLPPERVMAPVDLGSHILLYTPHAVVGAPYHRNQRGLVDTFRFFNGPEDAARNILAARGISLVVVCPALREMRGMVPFTADSLVAHFAAGTLPDWLIDESLPGGPLRVYAVRPLD